MVFDSIRMGSFAGVAVAGGLFCAGCGESGGGASENPVSEKVELVEAGTQDIPEVVGREGGGVGGFARIAELQDDGYQSDEVLEILEREVEADPAGAAAQVAGMAPGANRDACLEAVFLQWGGSDPMAAINFTGRRLSGMDVTVAAASIAQAMAGESPESAWSAISLVAEPISRGVVAGAIARGGAESDAPRTARWVQAMAVGPERDAAVRSLAETWSSLDADEAARWIDASLVAGEKSRAVEILMSNWGSLTPREAASWLAGQREALDYGACGVALAGSWALVEPRRTGEWVLTEPDAVFRTAFAKALMEGWVLNETSNAIAWGSVIEDPELRREALLAGFLAMQGDSPAALDQWIESNPSHPALTEAVEIRSGAGGTD
jgi:hypothetical protein